MFGKKKSQVDEHIDLLGLQVKDKVTGLEGVVTTMSFDLYGCIQAVLTPAAENGVVPNSSWFDVTRLEILDFSPVMQVPNFEKGYIAEGKKGPAEKPIK